jgi:hypothetical protein
MTDSHYMIAVSEVPISGHTVTVQSSSSDSVIISTVTPPIPPSLTNAPKPWIVHPQHTGKAPHSRYTIPQAMPSSYF